jgi:hypothetical protein
MRARRAHMRLAPEGTTTMTRKLALALVATAVLGIDSASACKTATFRSFAAEYLPENDLEVSM